MTVADLIRYLRQMDPTKELFANSAMGELEPLTANPFYDSNVSTYSTPYKGGVITEYVVDPAGNPVVMLDVP